MFSLHFPTRVLLQKLISITNIFQISYIPTGFVIFENSGLFRKKTHFPIIWAEKPFFPMFYFGRFFMFLTPSQSYRISWNTFCYNFFLVKNWIPCINMDCKYSFAVDNVINFGINVSFLIKSFSDLKEGRTKTPWKELLRWNEKHLKNVCKSYTSNFLWWVAKLTNDFKKYQVWIWELIGLYLILKWIYQNFKD